MMATESSFVESLTGNDIRNATTLQTTYSMNSTILTLVDNGNTHNNNPKLKQRQLDLNQPVKLGRQTTVPPSQTNAIFASRVLSRNHAVFTLVNGLPHVADIGSSNGTWLNGHRLSPENVPSKKFPLKNGDQLVFGVDIFGDDEKVQHSKVELSIVSEESSQAIIDLVNEEIKKTSIVSAELSQLKQDLSSMETVLRSTILPSTLQQQKSMDEARAETKLWKDKYNALAPLIAAQTDMETKYDLLSKDNQELQNKIKDLDIKIAALQQENLLIRESVSSKSTSNDPNNDQSTSIENAHAIISPNHTAELIEMEMSLEALREEFEMLKSNHEKLMEERDVTLKDLEETVKDKDDLLDQLNQLAKQNQQLVNQLKQLEEKVSEMETGHGSVLKDIENKGSNAQELWDLKSSEYEKRISDFQSLLSQAEADLVRLNHEHESERAKSVDQEHNLKLTLVEAKQNVSNLMTEIETLKTQVITLTKEKEDLFSIQDELHQVKEVLSEKTLSFKILEIEKQSLAEELQLKIQEMKEQETKLVKELNEVKVAKDRLCHDLEKEKAMSKQMKIQYEDEQEKVGELKKTMEELKMSISERTVEYERAIVQLEEQRVEKLRLNESLAQLEVRLAKQISNVEIKTKSMADLGGKAYQLESKLTASQESNKMLTLSLDELRSQVSDMKHSEKEHHDAMEALQSHFQHVSKGNKILVEQVEELNASKIQMVQEHESVLKVTRDKLEELNLSLKLVGTEKETLMNEIKNLQMKIKEMNADSEKSVYQNSSYHAQILRD